MKTPLTALMVGALAIATGAAFADDKTNATVTPDQQAKMNADAAAKRAADAKMTKEEKAAAKKAARAKKQAEADAMMKAANPNPNAVAKEDAKATAASKAGPAPAKGTLNTPESNKALQQQKGQ